MSSNKIPSRSVLSDRYYATVAVAALGGVTFGAVIGWLYGRTRQNSAINSSNESKSEQVNSIDIENSVSSAHGDDRQVQANAPWDKKGLARHFELGDTKSIESVHINEILLLLCPRLNDSLPQLHEHVPNPRSYANFISETNVILGDIVRKPTQAPSTRAYVRAGPRRILYFQPKTVRAAIVTCGGLCPGLNNVIRELVRMLITCYDVDKVYGLRCGYHGFHTSTGYQPMEMTVESVDRIHQYGGTVLGSDRGGFDVEAIKTFCRKYHVNQLYVLGGDGTHRGALKAHEALHEADMPVAVVGIPKTIDNDIDIIDRSFGFTTAVQEAINAIRSAATEASCAPDMIGIVKLMGRSSGFIAAHATLASGEVDICLIPEVPLILNGPNGVFQHIEACLQRKRHCVIVVAEGAGQEILPCELDEHGQPLKDAGGNCKLPPVGDWLKHQIKAHFADKGRIVGVKYIDPSYCIRSVPPTASDALYCLLLAQNAVHGAMAGYSGISVGLVNNRMVYLPITTIVQNSPRVMDPLGRTWERVVALTHQPNTAVPLDQHPAMKNVASFSAKTTF